MKDKAPTEMEKAKRERRRAKLTGATSRVHMPMVWVRRCRKSLSDSPVARSLQVLSPAITGAVLPCPHGLSTLLSCPAAA